ncbi:hypothetical protein H0E87_003601 [Populus deltoides]|uniref:Peptidyl-tRNA hydrolase family protein n=1 Tax=Populus deltoides TaxID=3696 RepID=A0A8T3A0E3_POPDE|nr:hypothetical protein H0E87_003601 [Populus deltoides]
MQVGFEMIDAFAGSLGISMNIPLCKALFGEGGFVPKHVLVVHFFASFCKRYELYLCGSTNTGLVISGFVGDAPVLLAKPQTYMNLSGESAGPLAAYYKLPLNRVIVFHDDMELPCGVLRLQEKGGHGCHRGLKSVINHFRGNREFARLRIGIGRPPGQMDPKAFLLQKFNATARERIDAALPEGVVALRCILFEGLTRTARWFNQEQKYKYIRSETMST